MDNFESYLQYQKEVVESKLKIIDRFQKGHRAKPEKRTSKINIAWQVLNAAKRPLHVNEIIQIAKTDYTVDLERDAIVSGIIKKVKAGKLFIRTAPNTFALNEYSSE
jgi:hypothetical protein